MNHNTLRLNRTDDPDYAEEGIQEENITWYAIGGLEEAEGWVETTKYPLVKNKEGKYEGIVKFTDKTLDIAAPAWGCRSDLFFKSSLGMYLQPGTDLDNDQKFIVPAKTQPLPVNTKNDRNGIKTFQAVAGTYKVVLDENNLEMQFECLEEDNSVTSGKFAIKADFNDNSSEAIYNPDKDATAIEIGGDPVPVYRRNDSGKCLLAPIGHLLVNFDMNHGTVRLVDPDNPDAIEKIGLTNLPKNTQVGIYTLDGRKVYSGMSQWNTATPGIYIMVKDGQAKKVLVK